MTKIATTAIIRRQDKILIGRRMRDDRWELPGGKITEGETPEDCIRREIKEELDLDVRIERPLVVLEGLYRDIPMKVYAYLTDWISGVAALNVHKEIRWIEPSSFADFDIVEEDRLVLEQWLGFDLSK